MNEHLPDLTTACLLALWGIARHENVRWYHAQTRGLWGVGARLATFAEFTATVALWFSVALLIGIGVQFGPFNAATSGAVIVAATIAWAQITRPSAFSWLLGMVAVYPLMIALTWRAG